MEDPTIKVVGNNGIVSEQTLWVFISRLIYEGDMIYSGDIKVYLNDEEVQQPVSMEADEDQSLVPVLKSLAPVLESLAPVLKSLAPVLDITEDITEDITRDIHHEFKEVSESVRQRGYSLNSAHKKKLYRERGHDLIDEDSTLRRTEKQEDLINEMKRYMGA